MSTHLHLPRSLIAGILLRAAALPGPAPATSPSGKSGATTRAHGVGEMYGVGGTPPERRELAYAGATATVDYPPLALYELGARRTTPTGLWSHRHFPNATALNAFVKLPALAAEIGLALLLFAIVRARLGIARGAAGGAGLLAEPGRALRRQHPRLSRRACSCCRRSARARRGRGGWPALAGALIAAAVLTKAQGVFIAPAVALAIWTNGAPDAADRRRC